MGWIGDTKIRLPKTDDASPKPMIAETDRGHIYRSLASQVGQDTRMLSIAAEFYFVRNVL